MNILNSRCKGAKLFLGAQYGCHRILTMEKSQSHLPHHLLHILQRHIQHTRDVEGCNDLHAPRLALHTNQILDVLFQITEAVGERLCSRRSLLLALRLLGLKGIQRLATVLTKPSVLRLEDDRRLQDLYRVPRPLRHHTTVATSGGVKQDAVRLVALIVIDHSTIFPHKRKTFSVLCG